MISRRLPGRLAVAILLTLPLGLAELPAAAGTINLDRMAASPNPRLGLAFPGSDTRHYPAIAQAGIGIARLSVAWARVEPSRGRFDWSGLDGRIAALQASGIEPFLTFESDAEWATDSATRRVRNALPSAMEDWRRFVTAVVERYNGDGRSDMPGLAGRVRYWQVANEWISDKNRSGGWAASTADLVEYIRTAHGAVKAGDPKAIFVLGGLAAFNMDVLLVARGGQEFTVRQKWDDHRETVLGLPEMRGLEVTSIIDSHVLPVLREAPYDVADVHLYGPESRDDARIAFLQELTGRPVLSAECGGPSLDYGGSYSPERHFLAVIERNLRVFAAGGRFCLWFLLGEDPSATYGNRYTALYTREAKAKPGVFAYRMLSRLIDPRTAVTKATGEPDLFDLHRGDGTHVRIGWNRAAAQVRAFVRDTGAEAYCLEDATRGRLTSELDQCDGAALMVAGRNLSALLAP